MTAHTLGCPGVPMQSGQERTNACRARMDHTHNPQTHNPPCNTRLIDSFVHSIVQSFIHSSQTQSRETAIERGILRSSQPFHKSNHQRTKHGNTLSRSNHSNDVQIPVYQTLDDFTNREDATINTVYSTISFFEDILFCSCSRAENIHLHRLNIHKS
jgi:hypothetical protein